MSKTQSNSWKIEKYDTLKSYFQRMQREHTSHDFDYRHFICDVCGTFEERHHDYICRNSQANEYLQCQQCRCTACKSCKIDGLCLECYNKPKEAVKENDEHEELEKREAECMNDFLTHHIEPAKCDQAVQ